MVKKTRRVLFGTWEEGRVITGLTLVKRKISWISGEAKRIFKRLSRHLHGGRQACLLQVLVWGAAAGRHSYDRGSSDNYGVEPDLRQAAASGGVGQRDAARGCV